MMKRVSLLFLLILSLAGAMIGAGCQPSWEFGLTGLGGQDLLINDQVWKEYADFAEEDAVPLEQILFGMGARVIAEIALTDLAGVQHTYTWEDASEEAWVLNNGVVMVAGQEITPSRIELTGSSWEEEVEIRIYDIAPTAAAALGIQAPDLSTGRSWDVEPADAVLLLFLDGFGYLRYEESLADDLIPELAGLGPPLLGLTTYPPITTVSTASLLTGTEPGVHGVEARGIRITDQETLLDAAANAGLQVVAVEGEALAFNLRSADLTLSGDRDGNGGTDDNVLSNALSVLEEGMPDLFYVHFHGIDDQGHEVGPGALAEEEKIQEVDAAVGQILDRLPAGTLVIIFADHGMHFVDEDGRLGNHGHLIARDMLIPVWIMRID